MRSPPLERGSWGWFHYAGPWQLTFSYGENNLPWKLTAEATGGGTTETDLIDLSRTVTSRAQSDHGQSSEDAQRGKEHVHASVAVFHLPEQVEAKFCICCRKRGHCGMEGSLRNETMKWVPRTSSVLWFLYSFICFKFALSFLQPGMWPSNTLEQKEKFPLVLCPCYQHSKLISPGNNVMTQSFISHCYSSVQCSYVPASVLLFIART